MAAGVYQGDLLELQKAAFARWKVDNEHQRTLSGLQDAEKKVEDLEGASDPLLYIQNLVKVKQLEKTERFQAFPREYKGELLQLQHQIFDRWRDSDEYRRLLLVRKRKRKPPSSIPRDLEWWEWIPISEEYKQSGSGKKVVGPGEGPGDPGFRSVEYKSDSNKERNASWDNQTREAYKSLEYNLHLTHKERQASQIDWNSRPVEFAQATRGHGEPKDTTKGRRSAF